MFTFLFNISGSGLCLLIMEKRIFSRDVPYKFLTYLKLNLELQSRSRGAEIILPPGAGAVITNYGFVPGSHSGYFYQRVEEILYKKVCDKMILQCRNFFLCMSWRQSPNSDGEGGGYPGSTRVPRVAASRGSYHCIVCRGSLWRRWRVSWQYTSSTCGIWPGILSLCCVEEADGDGGGYPGNARVPRVASGRGSYHCVVYRGS
jgi:hypothetical protein